MARDPVNKISKTLRFGSSSFLCCGLFLLFFSLSSAVLHNPFAFCRNFVLLKPNKRKLLKDWNFICFFWFWSSFFTRPYYQFLVLTLSVSGFLYPIFFILQIQTKLRGFNDSLTAAAFYRTEKTSIGSTKFSLFISFILWIVGIFLTV